MIAVPHAGRAYPSALVGQLRHSRDVVQKLEDRLVDRIGCEVARSTGAGLLVAHAPRAMIDLNRSLEDIDWEMLARADRPVEGGATISRRARSGLGLVPRRLPGVGELWRRRLEYDELAARIEGVHEPYHDALSAELEALRDRWGAALLIDLHSMPPLPARQGHPGAQVVLGDRFGATCHGSLVAAAFAHLAQRRRGAAHNRPYAGGYVLERHARPQGGIHALQVEIDRSRYLDGDLSGPGPGWDGIVADLTDLVGILAERVAELGQGDGAASWPVAAE